jgi:ABC-2 type transport system permease protein
VGTFAALLVLYLWTDLVSFLPDSLAQLLSSFDFQGVLDNFAYYSVFDLGGLLLYLSMAAVFVFLTVQVLQRRKGITSAATTAVVLAIAVVVNLVVGQLPSDLVERDISDNSLYTVSDTSVDYLSALERDVELVVLASEDTTDQRITKFLHNYAALSGHLSLSFVDPVEHPSALTEYEADQNTVVVRCADTGRQRVVPFSDILVADLMSYYTYGTYTYSEFDAEGQLTSAVDYVTSDNSHILYLAENHGESALGGSVTDAISKANLSTSTVSLLLDNGVPDDCSLLVFNQPQTDLSADEAQMVRDYLEGGGQVMILLTRTDLANFNAILADYGLAMAQGYIGDTARYYAQYGRFYFSATLSASSPITAQFGDDDLTLIYGAHGMTQCDPVRDTITVTPFMTTTESGYSDAGGQTGTYILGAQAEEETDGGTARLTVFTTESVVDQSILTFNPSMVNLDIFLNAATSGMEDISAISIPAKSLEITYNTVLNPGMWSTLYLAVIPLGVLIGGLAYWIKRRKL